MTRRMNEKATSGLEMRALTLKRFVEVSEALGIDGYEILSGLDIHPSVIQNPEERLPAARVIKALESGAKQSANSSFAIMMAEQRSFEDLGPMALLMQHLETPREVIEKSAAYKRYYNDLLEVHIEESAGQAFITWDLHPASNARQAMDLGVALAFLLLRGSSGQKWQADAIHLTRRAPEDLRPWHRFFDRPIEFESTFNGFSCSSAALSTRNPMANPLMANHAAGLLKLHPIASVDVDIRRRVNQRIISFLPVGRATLDDVAASLDVSPRKLQRQLANAGTTFTLLLDGVKLQTAKKHLSSSAISVSTIADMLGYGSTAAFSRWFSSKTGQQPTVWRSSWQ